MSRSEQKIFDELAVLCTSPGYVHALAHLSLRDGVVGYWEEMTPEDLGGWFKPDRLTPDALLRRGAFYLRPPSGRRSARLWLANHRPRSRMPPPKT